jgi:hypothetical protein
VVSRSGRELIPGGVELSDNATVDDLSAAIHAKGELAPFILPPFTFIKTRDDDVIHYMLGAIAIRRRRASKGGAIVWTWVRACSWCVW